MVAPYLAAAASVAGTVTSRAYSVTAATAAGDTLLVGIGVNNTTTTVSSVTDSKGNVYTLAGSAVGTSPIGYFYRSAGPNGGPSGGPTVPLTTSDTVTLTTAAVSGSVTIQLVGVPGAGALDVQSAAAVTGSAATGSATATPTIDADFAVSMWVTTNASGAVSASAPYTLLSSFTSGTSYVSTTYNQLGSGTAGVLQTATVTYGVSGGFRGFMWIIRVPALLPQQARHRAPALFTRITHPPAEAAYR